MGKILCVALLAAIFTSSFRMSRAEAGHEVGNGGNVVFCETFTTPLVLDYLLTRNMYGSSVKAVPVIDEAASLRRILLLLRQKVPNLAASFSVFVDNIGNRLEDRRYVWRDSEVELSLVGDENLNHLPLACGRRGSFEFKQAAVRYQELSSAGTLRTTIVYDPKVLRPLPPLQRSFLFVHEWLWELSSNVDRNRKINFFLHSTLFEKMSAKSARRELRRLGLRMP